MAASMNPVSRNSGIPAKALTRKTGPQNRPVSLEAAKATLRLSQNDATHDETIYRLIDGATSLFEQSTDTVVITQTFSMSLDAFPLRNEAIFLAQRPIQSITQIDYLDSEGDPQVLASDVWGFSAGKRLVYLKSGQSWPTVLDQTDAVEVTYDAGFGSGPSEIDRQIQQAILLLVGWWFYDPAQEGDAGSYDKAWDRIVDNNIRTTYP